MARRLRLRASSFARLLGLACAVAAACGACSRWGPSLAFAVPPPASPHPSPLPWGGDAAAGALGLAQHPKSTRRPASPSGGRPRPGATVAFSGAADAAKAGTTSVTASSLNLAKNLVGSGILSLPAGVAAFSASPAALWPALVFLAVATVLSAYGFFLIGRVCEETQSSTFGAAWKGSLKRGSWVPQLVCILECFGGSVVYAMVIGDVLSSLIGGFLPVGLPMRTLSILGIGVTTLFPLCCLRSFGQLSRFSLLGTIATSYVVLFVAKRFFDGSYGPGGAFFDASTHPVLQASGAVGLNANMLVLLSILSTAYLVHFNAPQMYAELEPGDAKATKQKKFALVGLYGFGIAAAQYALIMVFGFLTFGRATQGNVLLNYANGDLLGIGARAAIGISMLFGYPMQFAGLRSGILEAAGLEIDLPKGKHRLVTAAILGGILGVACLFHDLGKFQAIEGALLAAFLIYIAPPMMALRLWGGPWAKARFYTLIGIGIVLTVVGCKVTMA